MSNRGPLSAEHRAKLSASVKRARAEGRGNKKRDKSIPSVEHIQSSWGYWFAGLIDGEGSFTAVRPRSYDGVQLNFKLALRIDDILLLQSVHDTLGFGHLYTYRNNGRCWVGEFSTSRMSHNMAIVQLFKKFPLQSKKALDFERWSALVEKAFTTEHLLWSEVEGAIEELKVGRKSILSFLNETSEELS